MNSFEDFQDKQIFEVYDQKLQLRDSNQPQHLANLHP
jgi:hypothetical protein